MDALKGLIAEKRKNIDDDTQRPNKYMRRGDIERLKEEQERKAQEEKRAKQEAEKKDAAERAAAERARKVSLVSASIYERQN